MTLPFLNLEEDANSSSGQALIEGSSSSSSAQSPNADINELPPSNFISDEELAVVELESKIRSLQSEISVLEHDVIQIGGSQVLKEAYVSTRQRFQRFEQELRQSALSCAKSASLSSNSVDAEKAVFLTRLRFAKVLLDGCTKYKSALIQMLNHPASETFRAKRRTLTSKGKLILSKWFEEHRSNPFPTASEKEALARQADAPVEQISTWFINARARKLKKPRASNERGKKKQRRCRKIDDENDDSEDSDYEN